MQAMIDKVEHLISIKPKSNTKTRVVAHINETSLWYSEITIFFGEEYYSNFFTRNSKFQTWNEMPENQSLVKKNHLIIPAGLTIKGYFELLGDEDDDWEWQNNLWYIGELD